MADNGNFIDYVKIYVRSGRGGAGSPHLKREKYRPKAGPDGGDGGKGGSVIVRGNKQYWTLLHLKYQKHIFAEDGVSGMRDMWHGSDGKDVIIDCTGLIYIASSGLRILLGILKAAKANGSKVTLRGVNDDIKNVFKLTGFINLFEFE